MVRVRCAIFNRYSTSTWDQLQIIIIYGHSMLPNFYEKSCGHCGGFMLQFPTPELSSTDLVILTFFEL